MLDDAERRAEEIMREATEEVARINARIEMDVADAYGKMQERMKQGVAVHKRKLDEDFSEEVAKLENKAKERTEAAVRYVVEQALRTEV